MSADEHYVYAVDAIALKSKRPSPAAAGAEMDVCVVIVHAPIAEVRHSARDRPMSSQAVARLSQIAAAAAQRRNPSERRLARLPDSGKESKRDAYNCCQQQENMSLQTIQFTQEQARTLVGVTPGDLRHWRKSVPHLASRAGKAARFTFADLVGLAVAAELIQTFGVRITDMARGVDGLFRLLADARPTHLHGLVAVVGTEEAQLELIEELTGRKIAGPSLVIPCDPLIARLRAQMLPFSATSEQTNLPFLPRILKASS